MRIIKTAGHRTLDMIDKEKYPNRENQGLEGPFRQQSGHVLYYDTKQGKYYDPSRDMYVEDDELQIMQNPRPPINASKTKDKDDEPKSFTQIFDINREKDKKDKKTDD